MTSFHRMTLLALVTCGSVSAFTFTASAQPLHHHDRARLHHADGGRYMSAETTGSLGPLVQPAAGYAARNDDSANAKNPALLPYQQNMGGETGGPARMNIIE